MAKKILHEVSRDDCRKESLIIKSTVNIFEKFCSHRRETSLNS